MASKSLGTLMEDTVRRAFHAGHARALTHGYQEAVEYGYKDWRNHGPGAILPGGHAHEVVTPIRTARPTIGPELENLIREAMAAGIAWFGDAVADNRINMGAPLTVAIEDLPATFLRIRTSLVTSAIEEIMEQNR